MTDKGIACPVCGDTNSGVTNSRPLASGAVYRRRVCKANSHRFTTHETVTSADRDEPSQADALLDAFPRLGVDGVAHLVALIRIITGASEQ